MSSEQHGKSLKMIRKGVIFLFFQRRSDLTGISEQKGVYSSNQAIDLRFVPFPRFICGTFNSQCRAQNGVSNETIWCSLNDRNKNRTLHHNVHTRNKKIDFISIRSAIFTIKTNHNYASMRFSTISSQRKFVLTT